MAGEKVAHPLFLGTGKGDQRAGIEPRRSRHGAQAIEIGIYVGGDNVHKALICSQISGKKTHTGR
jgi:hypothetical protein